MDIKPQLDAQMQVRNRLKNYRNEKQICCASFEGERNTCN